MNQDKQKEKSVQYFCDGEALCDRIDAAVQELFVCEQNIAQNKSFLAQKRRTYKGSKFFLMTFIAALCAAPLCFALTLVFKLPVYYLILPISIAFGYYVRWKYIKNVLPVYENIYNKYIEAQRERIIELIEELYIDREQYEEILRLIPTNMRHPAAMAIMRESVETNYANLVRDAIDFYKKRYAIIRRIRSESATNLRHEIEFSEEQAASRAQTMAELENITTPYV